MARIVDVNFCRVRPVYCMVDRTCSIYIHLCTDSMFTVHRKGKRGQTEIYPPVNEDIPLEKTPPIELTKTMFSLYTVYSQHR